MPDSGVRVATLLDAAATRLRAGGLEDPRREARRIWNDLAELAGRLPNADRDEIAGPQAAAAFQSAVARREAGEPLAYVTGLAGFRRLTLRVDRRVLIPRPETEGLVDLMLARCPSGRLADVGTGSGCLALALADEGAYALVAAVDSSRPALEVARENRGRTGGAVELIRGDLLEPFAPDSLDAVVSNPPYLTEREYRELSPSVRDWEPREALASGEDGMGATIRVIRGATRVTRRGGWLALEVDVSRASDVAGVAAAAGWSEVEIQMDLFDRARYVLARRSEAE